MSKICLAIGLAVGSIGAIAAGAIANPVAPSAPAMTDLTLPVLTTPVPPAPAASGQELTQILPSANFTDVSPNHWAYTAVNILAEDYACLAGYADGTFRGDEFVTRYEFAAALNACMEAVVQLIDQPQVDAEQILNELEALNRELGTLTEEVDAHESLQEAK